VVISVTRSVLALALSAALLLAGCGYAPLYATEAYGGADVGADLAQVSVARIRDRGGQRLRTQLLDRLHPNGPAVPAWQLRVSLSEDQQSLGVRTDDTTRRVVLTLTAGVRLVPMGAEAADAAFTSRSVTSFNVLDDPFAADIAEQDARDRAINELADQIALQLATHFSGR